MSSQFDVHDILLASSDDEIDVQRGRRQCIRERIVVGTNRKPKEATNNFLLLLLLCTGVLAVARY